MSSLEKNLAFLVDKANLTASVEDNLSSLIQAFCKNPELICLVFAQGKPRPLGYISFREISLHALNSSDSFKAAKPKAGKAKKPAGDVKLSDICRPIEVYLDETDTPLIAWNKMQEKKAQIAIVNPKDKSPAINVVRRGRLEEFLCQSVAKMQEMESINLSSLRQRDDYLGIVCHDIRSPLGIISVCCDYLLTNDPNKKKQFSDEQIDFIDRIKRNSGKALGLVSSLLDVGRLSSGGSLDLEDVFLPSYLDNIVTNLQLLALKKDITIVHRYETPIQAAIDVKRFYQVIENLVTNAIKFSPRGKNIYISTTLNPGGRSDHVSIAIQDEGFGIPKSKVSELFEKYRQNDALIAKELGVGLGLSIARQYAHLHQGWIEVESDEGKGSTFSVVIPNAKLATEKVKIMAENRLKVLVVDDDSSIVEFLKNKLEERGAYVVTASDGDKAINQYRLHHPHIVISDLNMPRTDGLELVHTIKANSEKIPFILSSGYYNQAGLAKAKEIFNTDRILVKPIDAQDLYDAIDSCLKEYQLDYLIFKKAG